MKSLKVVRGWVVAAGTVLWVTGCFEEYRDTLAPIQEETRIPAVQLRSVRGPERAFAELAEEVPSSGGFFFDQGGNLVVVLRDVEEEAAAISAVGAMVSTNRISTFQPVAGVRVRSGDFTFLELARWRDIIFDEVLLELEGVTTLDINEELNRVQIGIDPDQPGLQLEVLEIIERLKINPEAIVFEPARPTPAFLPDSLHYQFDTLVAGIQILHIANDTIWGCNSGFIAEDSILVTASHCSPTWYGLDGDDRFQVDTTSSRYIGYESSDPEGTPCGGNECRDSDAAKVFLDGNVPFEAGLIARTTWRSHSSAGSRALDSSDPYFIIRSEQTPLYSGYEVNKVGYKTGWTYGSVNGTCYDAEYDDYDKVLVCAYKATFYLEGGDSGSPVFMWDGGEAVALAGILSGKVDGSNDAIFSGMSAIEDELGSLTAERGANLSTPSLSGSVSGSNPSLSWSSITGATHYQVFREIHNNSGSCTEESLTHIGTTTLTSFLDDEVTASQYYGTNNPGPRVPCYAQYRIYAASGSDVSDDSAWVYFSMPDEE